MKSTSIIALGVVLVVGLFIGCAESQKKSAMTGAHPKFETLCSKCHSLDRVEAMHKLLKEEEMRTIVDRMSKKPGSGIDPTDINDIVRELY
ncbi:MAG: photosystem P840 reaction-center cytochrome c-551 [Candidatus Omnitrophica bacterium]|nr:photosystem P840 reaction-center cytochrome c-551 [Candidatus Omnitrophota bacterium]